MPSVPRDTIEHSLSQKGFHLDNQRDHRYYYFIYNGKRTKVRTKVSVGKKHKDYGEPLLKAMTFQLFLTFKDTLDLLRCPMDHDTYVKKLFERGVLTAADNTSSSSQS